MKRALVLALALLAGAVPGLFAQIAGGNIYGSITDESGAVLPGAVVTVSSDFGTRTTTAGSQGEFRFLNLERGRYKVGVALAGFTSVTRDINVVTGENVNLAFSLKVASQQETVTVTAEAPLVDVKKRGTATTMTTEELNLVPNARDPWGVLKNVPGVLLDRINIAGNENGQQAAVAGKGSTSGDKIWNLDGINITDMAATGASPSYYDFGAFQEITISTGGMDLNAQTGGIGINLVTKRGTNKFHGSTRYVLANHKLESGNLPDAVKNDPRLKGNSRANSIDQVADYGFDLGGPIIKDKLWFYGTYGKQDIRLLNYTQTHDKTLLPSYNAKLNWQALSDTMVSAFWFVGKKQKFGRAPGYAVPESADTLWNQDNAYTNGGLPGGLWKAQIDHTFSPNFFMSAKAAYYDTGFGFAPTGGTDKDLTLDYVRGEAIGSSYTYLAIRPQKTINVDGNYFFGAMGGNHELKFGFGYRKLTTNSVTSYSGNQLQGELNSATDPSENVVYVTREGNVNYGGKYTSAYLGDVFTKNRFTLNLGARWDLQTARNLPSEARANKAFPNLLPAVQYGGDSKDLIRWNDISPRLGMSYALDEGRKTILRTSFARYASQLSYGNVTRENPVSFGYLAYQWTDKNGDRLPQPNEVNLAQFVTSSQVDPQNPGAVGTTVGKVDRDLKAKHDNEFIIGIDHELGPNFAVGAAYTWRRATDWDYIPRLGGACSDPANPTAATCRIIQPSEYTRNAPVTSNGFTAFTYSPLAALVDAGKGGRIRTNRPGFYTNFSGPELTLTKRLSHKWMGRVAFSYNDWTDHWKNGVTPTNGGTPSGNPTSLESDALVQGGQHAELSGGSGKASFYTSVKWQLYANALVQLPGSFDFSGAVFGKQGGSYPLNSRLAGGRDSTLAVMVTPTVDSKRHDTLWDADARLSRTIRFGGAGLTLAAEAFNVFNNNVVLSRSRQTNSATFLSTIAGAEPANQLGRVEEIISPRILRLNVSFSF
jgi:hypothetical protein